MSTVTEGWQTEITTTAIRNHYDLATPFYRLVWGSHIHHGLWEADESPDQAQLQLTERLCAEAAIAPGSRVLDVGCGMGGSSLYLAREKACRIRGLTLSRVQWLWATLAAWRERQGRNVRFRCCDVEQVDLPPGSFEVVWSIECTEHLFDKAAFFRRAADWLVPGGRVAICAWLGGPEPHSVQVAEQIRAVCEGFLCPSLGTRAEYLAWMEEAGLEPVACHDWTGKIAQTWEICERRLRRTHLDRLAWCVGPNMRRFVDRFRTIFDAYQSGAMEYGCFVARKP
jgi:tocopherol O-methyltransferase